MLTEGECYTMEPNEFVKDISILHQRRSEKRLLLIDTEAAAIGLNRQNGLPIHKYTGGNSDHALYYLKDYLCCLIENKKSDFRNAIRNDFHV
jgi:hypothetical protein